MRRAALAETPRVLARLREEPGVSANVAASKSMLLNIIQPVGFATIKWKSLLFFRV
jgi:hypothetical protein